MKLKGELLDRADVADLFNSAPLESRKAAFDSAKTTPVPATPSGAAAGPKEIDLVQPLPKIGPAAAAPVEPPAQRKSVGQLDIEKAGSTEAVKKIGEEVGNIAKEVITLGKSANERELRYNDVVSVVTDPEMKNIFGILAKSGMAPFILKTLESGANVGQFGSLGIANLERNLAEAGASKEQISKLRRVEKHLKQAELEYARVYLSGQGAVSDAERKLVREAVGSTNDPAQILEMQARVMAQRAKFDAQMSDAYEKYRTKAGTYADPDQFFRNEGRSIKQQHNQELGKILGVVGVKVPLDMDPLQAPPTKTEGSSTKQDVRFLIDKKYPKRK